MQHDANTTHPNLIEKVLKNLLIYNRKDISKIRYEQNMQVHCEIELFYVHYNQCGIWLKMAVTELYLYYMFKFSSCSYDVSKSIIVRKFYLVYLSLLTFV